MFMAWVTLNRAGQHSRSSLVHSQKVTKHLIETYLGVGNRDASLSAMYGAAESQIAKQTDAIEEKIEKLPADFPESAIAKIEQHIRALQRRAGYTSYYDSWITKVTPADLE